MITNIKIAPDDVNAIEVRPTLIVGLGGTGTVIAQWAYRFITDVFGEVPPFIRFLVLDTDVQEPSDAGTLPIATFVNLYERLDLRPILREFREHPDDFPFLSWLQGMPLDSSLISSGCQGLSRLGRVVYFLTRESVIEPEVTRHLRELTYSHLPERLRAFDDSGQFVLAQNGRPLVHICASICGGTGSGLLLDLAYDIRHWGRSVSQSEPDVIGHLLLPEAFSVGEDLIREKLRSVARAMLDQIDLLANRHRDHLEIEYRNGEKRRISPLEAPFDLCYLINGNSRAGSADRSTLTAMMGRMVAAFAYEPLGRQVLADANNKQQDVLAREEGQRRRMFFASYGLACGAAQSQDRNRQHVAAVRQWVARALAELGGENREALREELDRARRKLQQVTDVRAKIEIPEFRLAVVQSTNPRDIADRVKKSLQDQLESLKVRIQDGVAAELTKRLNELKSELRDAAVDGLERGLHVPATIFRAYYEALSERLRQIPYEDQTRDVRDRALAELKSDYPSVGRARQEAERVWGEYGRQLALAVAHRVMHRQLSDLLRWVEQRIQALERSASSAPRQATGAPSEDASPIPYGIRLVDLGYPLQLDGGRRESDGAGRPETDSLRSPLDEIKRRFLKDLLAPTVRDLLELSDVSDPSVDQVVNAALRYRDPAFDQFWRTYCEESLRLIYQTADSRSTTGHPLNPRLIQLKKQSQPRLAINQKGKYREPLEVAFSQQMKDSCFPDLLKPLIGHDLRVSYVTPEYVQKTNILVELAQFAYGISVPAIDNYESYSAAVHRYLANTDMAPNHLWLDDRWYEEFERITRKHAAELTEHQPESIAEIVNDLSKITAMFMEETERCAQRVSEPAVRTELERRLSATRHLLGALNILREDEQEGNGHAALEALRRAVAAVGDLNAEDGSPHEQLAALTDLQDRLARVLSGSGRFAAGG